MIKSKPQHKQVTAPKAINPLSTFKATKRRNIQFRLQETIEKFALAKDTSAFDQVRRGLASEGGKRQKVEMFKRRLSQNYMESLATEHDEDCRSNQQ